MNLTDFEIMAKSEVNIDTKLNSFKFKGEFVFR